MGFKLPVDATGKEIPLDAKVLYHDGHAITPCCFEYYPIEDCWSLRAASDEHVFIGYPNECTIDPPDSWEKLLADLDDSAESKINPICDFAKLVSPEDPCIDCNLCNKKALKDIAGRIRKLRGEGDV